MNNNSNPLKTIEERQEKQQKKLDDAFNERMKQDEERRHHMELERTKHINASGLSQDAYAIRETLLMINRSPGKDFYQPSLIQLGFADIVQAHSLFIMLKNEGCFKDIERSGNDHLTFRGVNLRRLKKQLRIFKQIEQSFGERFLRHVSHGSIGLNNVLTVIVTLLTIATMILAIRSTNQKNEINALENDLNMCQDQKSQETTPLMESPAI